MKGDHVVDSRVVRGETPFVMQFVKRRHDVSQRQ